MKEQEINQKAKEIPPKEILKELLQFGSYNILPNFGEESDGKENL